MKRKAIHMLTREKSRVYRKAWLRKLWENKPKIPEKPQPTNHDPNRKSPALSELTLKCPSSEMSAPSSASPALLPVLPS